MDTMQFLNFLFRWGHVLFGITWIGMLYYFNFVQGAYFKEATPEALGDAKAKLAPRALWWFRWGAMFTFLTGVVLLVGVMQLGVLNDFILVGGLLGRAGALFHRAYRARHVSECGGLRFQDPRNGYRPEDFGAGPGRGL